MHADTSDHAMVTLCHMGEPFKDGAALLMLHGFN